MSETFLINRHAYLKHLWHCCIAIPVLRLAESLGYRPLIDALLCLHARVCKWGNQ
jgi:hypothetical protein